MEIEKDTTQEVKRKKTTVGMGREGTEFTEEKAFCATPEAMQYRSN